MNLTTGKRLAGLVRRADTLRDRTRGLLGSTSLPADTGLWIDPCPSIHMFFMRYAIDVIFVDSSLRVIRAVEHVPPWRVAFGGRGARSALELPVGTIAQSETKEGDTLAIQPVE